MNNCSKRELAQIVIASGVAAILVYAFAVLMLSCG